MFVASVLAVLSFAVVAFGQSGDWVVLVDGSPVALPRPVVRTGGDLFIPILAVARALGFQVEAAPEIRGLRARRGAGAAAEYDGRNGEIRFGPVVAGQLRNYTQVTVSGPLEELLFPVDGLIPLLSVDVREDQGENVLQINSSREPVKLPSAHGMGLSSLDYTVGVTMVNGSNGHYTLLRSDALGGGIPLVSNFLFTGTGTDLSLRQGTVIANVGGRRALTVGDQTSVGGIDSMVSSVRGVGYSSPFKGFDATMYAGKTAGTVRSVLGSPGVASYDSSIAGGALRKRNQNGDLSFAASSFNGPDRNGTSAGGAFTKITRRNQMRAQVTAGTFSGFSVRTLSGMGTDPATSPATSIEPSQIQIAERAYVQGAAVGLNFLDTFSPVEPLAITAQVVRYGKNFLTPREDSEFNAQATERVLMTLKPLTSVSLYGGVTRRHYLLGESGVMHGFTYGASGAVPALAWLHFGYFRLVQNDAAAVLGRLELSQYSATVLNVREYSGIFMFSNLKTSGSPARTLNATVSRDFFQFGHLSVHDQLQFNTSHRYGAEWEVRIPHGNLRLGLDRLTSLQANERSIIPVVGLVFQLAKQRLQVTYSGDRGIHMLSFTIGGPLIARENVRKDADGRVSLTATASLEGQVYFDSDANNVFSAGIDTPMPDITVWLDEQTSVRSDAKGFFRFERVNPGTHAIHADLAEVPADMVFEDSEERRIAVLPFRKNIQNFAVVRTGALTGKVTYLDYSQDDEKPVQRPLAEARVIADGEHDTYSDADGNITIASLPPGTYQLKVDPETAPEGYVALEPQEVRVTAGETLRGLRIQLVMPPRPVIIKDLPNQESVSFP